MLLLKTVTAVIGKNRYSVVPSVHTCTCSPLYQVMSYGVRFGANTDLRSEAPTTSMHGGPEITSYSRTAVVAEYSTHLRRFAMNPPSPVCYTK